MSSRGQIVIPQALRQAAGIAEGDEVEVAFDGRRLVLCRLDDAGEGRPPSPSADAGLVLREDGIAYATPGSVAAPGPPHTPKRRSAVWADRLQALAEIRRLGAEFAGVASGDLLAEARRELEERLPPC